MKHFALAIVEYLLGFFALAVFAAVAFATALPSDEHLIYAFKVGGVVALAELAVLLWRAAPANRLIVGANLWLLAGGVAAFAQQWWWLKGYQRLGEAGLFVSMLLVGIATTVFSPKGFVAAPGERRRVIFASLVLLAAVGIALAASVRYRGDVKLAAVLPVIALSWVGRLLGHSPLSKRRLTLPSSGRSKACCAAFRDGLHNVTRCDV
ncbi:MAG: hypothetical protein M3Y55_07125 [Pseudomonadota bacterium]|nr:hypothetical protein [Pseudomonadota bacterium]